MASHPETEPDTTADPEPNTWTGNHFPRMLRYTLPLRQGVGPAGDPTWVVWVDMQLPADLNDADLERLNRLLRLLMVPPE